MLVFVFCVTGFMPEFEILDLVCRVSYNYCCSYVLSKTAVSEQSHLGIGSQTDTSSCLDWQLEDVIVFLSETSK